MHTPQEHRLKHALYIIGAAFEVVGIMLAVGPDLVPGARRFSRWLEPRWRRSRTVCADYFG